MSDLNETLSTPAAPLRALEPPAVRYARHTRNAVVFIAVVLAIGLVAAIVIGVITGFHGAQSGSGTPAATSTAVCQSQGGYDPIC